MEHVQHTQHHHSHKSKRFKIPLPRKKKHIIVCIIIAVVGALILFFLRKENPQEQPVVTVGTIIITQQELDTEEQAYTAFYKYLEENKRPHDAPSDIKEETLQLLIDEKLIENFANEQSVTVSDEELARQYEQAYKSVGTEAEYLEKLKTMYGLDKEGVLQKIKKDLLRQRVTTQVGSIDPWLTKARKTTKIQKHTK